MSVSAFDPQTVDPQTRAADPTISAFVTANAGSGKTKTLIDRVARLLLTGVEPGAILCVTYTKAAAAEMQRRLFEVLGDWSVAADDKLRSDLGRLGSDPDQDLAKDLSGARRLFARALETPGGLKIQTLHAFCEKLLRRFPLEAGLSPGFSVLDDVEAHGLTTQARAAVARHALGRAGPVADAYAHMSVELAFDAFGQMFKGFEARRGYLAEHLAREGGLDGAIGRAWASCGFNGPTSPEIQETAALGGIDAALWREVVAVLTADGGKENIKRAERMARVAAGEATGFDDVRGLFITGKGEAATWVESSVALKKTPGLRERLLVEQNRILAAAERIRAANIGVTTAHVVTLADAYLTAYRDLKTLSGKLDFADLVERAKALIATRPEAAWVLYKLDGGIDHVLVDEAQDTSPDQWTIVRALTAEFFAGSGVRAEAEAARQLFVVGDEKQSIYSFQGARPDLLDDEFLAQKAAAEGAGAVLERVKLLASWRSTPEILAFVDAVFAPGHLTAAISPRADGEAVRHIATRIDHRGCVDLWAPEVQATPEKRDAWTRPLDLQTEDSAYRRLARRIAAEIVALIARGDAVYDKTLDVDRRKGGWRAARPEDVLILVRRRGPLFQEIIRALKLAGLPTAGADRLKLSEHIVFQDLLALARFLQAPQDDLTLAALLKSPLCGLDDQAVFDLAYARGRMTLWDRLRERAPTNPAWAAALTILDSARTSAATCAPYETYMAVLARRGADGRTLRRALVSRLGDEADEALNAFLAQVLAAEARGLTEFEGLAAGLEALEIEVKREMEAPAGQVRVMTAHGAKGLEAPIVFLPDITQTQGARGSPLLETAEGGVLWSSRQGDDCAASAAARTTRDRRAEDETYRLLYVALTRARDRLVLCGRVNEGEFKRLETLGGWWRAVDNAMTGLGSAVRHVDDPTGAFRRYGPDPRRVARMGAQADRHPHPPAWIDRAAAAETPARLTAPSEAGETRPTPAPSPLGQTDGLGRFRRGELIHRLLELLPELAPETRAEAAGRLLSREADLSDAHRSEMAQAALAVLDDKRFADVFGPGSRAEAVVAGSSSRLPPGLRLSGRVDRLVVLPDRVLVVDFKTNRPAPDRIEDADPSYIRQLALYAAVLGEVFPGRRIEAALVWTDGPKLMPVPENMLSETLAALAGDG